jgi:mycothiol synthase
MGDIDAVYQLISAQNKVDFGDRLRSLEEIRRGWTANFDLELDSLVAVASNGQIAGYAELRDREDIHVYLASEFQDAALGRHLIAFLEERAASYKTEGRGVELWGRAGFRNPVLIDAYEKSGYQSDISFLIMEIALKHGPPVPTWPAGIVVRPFIPSHDEQAVYRADEEAAQDKGYHEPLSYENWAKRIGLDKQTFDPAIWFVAAASDEVAGVALNAIGENSTVGWVDHLSVRRAWRRQGIGRSLLLHTFAQFFKRGIHTVKLSVDSKSLTNAPRLYESVGMKTIEKYFVFKKGL